MIQTTHSTANTGWRTLVAQYQQPDLWTSIWQIVNSFGGLILCWVLMYFSLSIGYWLTLLLAAPAAGFLVRILLFNMTAGMLRSSVLVRANDLVGTVCSILTLIPYKFWRRSHAVHHAHHAELEGRGIGDIWTMTVDEYRQAPLWRRIAYRIFRNPLFLFGIAPTINFVLLTRLPFGGEESWRHGEKASIWWTNLALAGWVSAASALIGFDTVIAIQLPVIVIAGNVGAWLFYVQHQFEHTYWEHTPQWDYTLAALSGSTYYKLPRLLQWFTGNIGFHHIHHLSPRIPNYRLQQCHEQNPLFHNVVELTLWSSLRTVQLALWDEKRRLLVSFREALQLDQLAPATPPLSDS